ncbi:MAG: MSHA biogenesis protein MshK [Burkholderiales bacterium]|nr:MSHA biogenesis protein MshK [Burkholderiales bacterium]
MAATTASAQGLADPTRPPAALAAAGGAAAAGGGPVLQSVMLSPGRKMAMISGQMVLLGGRYGSARLVRLTDSEAELKDGSETIVLSLYPQVDKRPADKMQRGETAAGKTKK